jgi:mannosyltransferase
VHTLATALLLQPNEVHHFSDLGYTHDNFWTQPYNTPGLQLPIADLGATSWAKERVGGVGCRCQREEDKTANIPDVCFAKLGRGIGVG